MIGAPAITFPCNHYALQTVSEDQQPIIEGRTKPVFAVVYRSQKQPATPVALASLIDFNHTLLLQLTQVGDRIRLETVLSPELGMYSVESGKIPSLADFEYHILHLTAIRAGAQDSKFRSPIIQLEIYSNKRDPVIEVLEIKYPVNSIVFSEVNVLCCASLDSWSAHCLFLFHPLSPLSLPVPNEPVLLATA